MTVIATLFTGILAVIWVAAKVWGQYPTSGPTPPVAEKTRSAASLEAERPLETAAYPPRPPAELLYRPERADFSSDAEYQSALSAAQDQAERCQIWAAATRSTPAPPTGQLLAQALRDRDEARVERLLAAGAPDFRGVSPEVARMLRGKRIGMKLYRPAAAGDVAELKRLLRLGADPNLSGGEDTALSPLAVAAQCNRADAVVVLIAGGADPNLRLNWWFGRGAYTNSTALHWAARSNAPGAARALLCAGADPNARERVALYDDERGDYDLVRTRQADSVRDAAHESPAVLRLLSIPRAKLGC